MPAAVSDAQLVELALATRESAYAPYSGFRVGAALLTAGGRVFTGCNVENASYGLTVCAERVAVFSAVAGGAREFTALAVVGDGEGYCCPCGACLQVLHEFGPQVRLLLADARGGFRVKTVAELLPGGFSLSRND
ncbi:MAG: cytidine deaminase [Candidatus Desulforudis sp.]|nr:cytidine deaminase [Desulforudis sp.]